MTYSEWYSLHILPYLSNIFGLQSYVVFKYVNSLPTKSKLIHFDNFNIKSTGSDRHDVEISKSKGYFAIMSPLEYMLRCGLNIRKNGLQKWFDGSLKSFEPQSTVDSIVTGMKQGVKFYTPYIDYQLSTQDGRHRAMAAWMLSIKQIPVWIFPPSCP